MSNVDRMLQEIDMFYFYEKDSDFQKYCHKCMGTYGKTLTQVLESPITVAYYKTLLPGGCNYREVQE